MARKVIWTDPAVDDLESTVEFIAKDSPSYAAAFAQQICDAGDSLAESSERGHRLLDPELRHFRELFVGRYRVIYTVEPQSVTLHAVLHGSRDLSKALQGRAKPR